MKLHNHQRTTQLDWDSLHQAMRAGRCPSQQARRSGRCTACASGRRCDHSCEKGPNSSSQPTTLHKCHMCTAEGQQMMQHSTLPSPVGQTARQNSYLVVFHSSSSHWQPGYIYKQKQGQLHQLLQHRLACHCTGQLSCNLLQSDILSTMLCCLGFQ